MDFYFSVMSLTLAWVSTSSSMQTREVRTRTFLLYSATSLILVRLSISDPIRSNFSGLFSIPDMSSSTVLSLWSKL